ncbi:hypothetical protein [Pseudonocardia sediminis]|uniref:hypothetical protein n=1 Tax=Pseudonocardia sediminis TaxID=1397368 RepID=UPI0010299B95|nr:hypothetical protein [Pseudonocardia sediminis]
MTDQNVPHGESALAVAFSTDLDSGPAAMTPVDPAAAPGPDSPDDLLPSGQGSGPASVPAGETLQSASGGDIALRALREAKDVAQQRAEADRAEADRQDDDAEQDVNPPRPDDAPEDGGSAGGECERGRSGFGAVRASVASAGEELRCRFDISTVYGVAGRSNASDHPRGRALDFMADPSAGEPLANYAAKNLDRLGISYVIYRQRINFGNGWEQMEDRGGVTANHMDHVHVSFN